MVYCHHWECSGLSKVPLREGGNDTKCHTGQRGAKSVTYYLNEPKVTHNLTQQTRALIYI
jgi:hypothetical protein